MWLLVVGTALSSAAGWFLVAALWTRPVDRSPNRGLLLRAWLSLGLGLWASSCGFFLALLLQATAPWQVVLLDVAVLGVALSTWRALRCVGDAGAPEVAPPSEPRWPGLAAQGLALAVGAIALRIMVLRHRAEPYGHWDAWAIWNLKARFFFEGGERWTNAFSETIAWSHPDYPLLLPLVVTRSWTLLGESPTLVPAIIAVLFSALVVLTLYAVVALLRDRLQGAVAALALLGSPGFVEHGSTQLADTPVGFHLLAALSVLALALQRAPASARMLVLTGLFAGAAAWTKNEGLLMAFAVLLVATWVGARHDGSQRWRAGLAVALGLAVPLAFVLGLKAAFAGESDLLAGQSWQGILEKVGDWRRHQTILAALGRAVVSVTSPWLLVGLALFGLSVGPVRLGGRSDLAAVALVLALVVGGYYGIYLVTPRELGWHLFTSGDRLVVQLLPSLLLLLFATLRTPAEVRASRNRGARST